MEVSVVIPVRNGVRYIGDAIASALAQPDVKRVIVVDDDSTDASAETAARAGDDRVTLLQGTGQGVSAARNLGFAEVERLSRALENDQKWVMFLDADDRLVPGATQKLVAAARADCVAVYGEYERIDADGHRIGRRSMLRQRSKPSGDILRYLLTGNFIVNGGVMLIRQARFRQALGFDETLRYCEDWHLFCRLAGLGPIIWRPRTTVLEYRVHNSSAMMSRRLGCLDYREAVDRIFTDPMIVGKFSPPDLVRLQRKAEAHLKTYLACQAIRSRAYGRAIRETAQVIAFLPSQTPKTLAHAFGALAGF